MVEKSRRTFLRHASLGAATVGLGATVPVLVAAPALGAQARSGRFHGPLVAYLRDHRSGDIAVMVGEREVVVHDPELAARLAHVADSAK